MPLCGRFNIEVYKTAEEERQYQKALSLQLGKLMTKDSERLLYFYLKELETTKPLGLFINAPKLRPLSADCLWKM